MDQTVFLSRIPPKYQQWLVFPRLHWLLVGILTTLWISVNHWSKTPLVHTDIPNDPIAKGYSNATSQQTAPPRPTLSHDSDQPTLAFSPDFFDPLTVSSTFSATPTPIPQDLLAGHPINWETHTIQSGDNLSTVFYRAGLNDRDVYRLVSGHKKAKELTKMRPGQSLELEINDQELKALRFQKDRLTTIEYRHSGNEYQRTIHVAKPDVRRTIRSGTIHSSLFLAAKKAGLDDGLVMQLATIFGWDIDFALDIREGDTFKVIFEEEYLDGEKLGNGHILAAEFLNKGNSFQAVRFEDTQGDAHYYTPDGKSMRKAFLRSPLDIVRITSHFNLRRKHPVLNRIRAHKGTDYGARSGTPIKSVGDGKITFVGWKGGYGRVIYVDHGRGYKTRYAHMKKFHKGMKPGKRIKQGDVIGYVGKSGLATAPHLHYEFHHNGRVRNPVTVKLPNDRPLPNSQRQAFKTVSRPLMAMLEEHTNTLQLAAKTSEESSSVIEKASIKL